MAGAARRAHRPPHSGPAAARGRCREHLHNHLSVSHAGRLIAPDDFDLCVHGRRRREPHLCWGELASEVTLPGRVPGALSIRRSNLKNLTSRSDKSALRAVRAVRAVAAGIVSWRTENDTITLALSKPAEHVAT